MNSTTPIIFTDGTEFYNNLSKTYVQHTSGLFILAPSGTGKTYFVTHQKTNHWIDGDYLWPATGADLSSDEWMNDYSEVEAINSKSDIITHQAKKLGYWIIGSSNNFLKPDAIVLPEWEAHVTLIKKRETNEYDGGATSEDLEQLLAHRAIIARWKEQNVPCFESIAEAADALTTT